MTAEAVHWFTVTTWASLASALTSFATGQGQQSHIKCETQGFYSNNWGADLAPDKAVTPTEKRGGYAQYPGQALDTTTPITPPYQGDNGQHTLRKDMVGIQPLHQKYWTYTVYTGMLPHKNSPLRPQ